MLYFIMQLIKIMMKEIKIFDRIVYYELNDYSSVTLGPISHEYITTTFYKKVIKKRKLFFALELIEWITGYNLTTEYYYEELFTFPYNVEDKYLTKEIKIEIIKRIANKIL